MSYGSWKAYLTSTGVLHSALGSVSAAKREDLKSRSRQDQYGGEKMSE
jgi:hypothetical protein